MSFGIFRTRQEHSFLHHPLLLCHVVGHSSLEKCKMIKERMIDEFPQIAGTIITRQFELLIKSHPHQCDRCLWLLRVLVDNDNSNQSVPNELRIISGNVFPSSCRRHRWTWIFNGFPVRWLIQDSANSTKSPLPGIDQRKGLFIFDRNPLEDVLQPTSNDIQWHWKESD